MFCVGTWIFGSGLIVVALSLVCLMADISPSASYLIKPQVTKGFVLPVGPFLRQGSFTPVPLRGPAPNGHPCPDGALAASMRLGPLRETCVQPAPKSRSAVAGPFAYEDQKHGNGNSNGNSNGIREQARSHR